MTRQRWWDAYRLRQIRCGVTMGMYHRSSRYSARRDALVIIQDVGKRELTDYERGLVHGYEAVQNIFKQVEL